VEDDASASHRAAHESTVELVLPVSLLMMPLPQYDFLTAEVDLNARRAQIKQLIECK